MLCLVDESDSMRVHCLAFCDAGLRFFYASLRSSALLAPAFSMRLAARLL
jgi:hypothetical protein